MRSIKEWQSNHCCRGNPGVGASPQTGQQDARVRWSHWWSMWLTCIIEQSQVKLGFGAGPSGEDHRCIKGNGWPLLQKRWPFFSQMLRDVTFNVMAKEIIFLMLQAALTTVVLTDHRCPTAMHTGLCLPYRLISGLHAVYETVASIDKDFLQFSADLRLKVPYCANYTLCMKSPSLTLVCATFQKVCATQVFVWKL